MSPPHAVSLVSESALSLEPGKSIVIVGTVTRDDGTHLNGGQATTLRLTALPAPQAPAPAPEESLLLNRLAHGLSLYSCQQELMISRAQIIFYATTLRRRYQARTRPALIYAAQRAGHLHACDRPRLPLADHEIRQLRWLAWGGTIKTYAATHHRPYGSQCTAHRSLLRDIRAETTEHAVHLVASWGYLDGSTRPTQVPEYAT
ncbi:hypothetical protein [Streptomyces catenulae]|uniref:Uncharacterized protein n=1 Tax=Streptomyces catenulae TaxID=66875 RepID=A0ABV2YTI1_9ACTN|nr:hypothetical protein [Streptomyces catenulae]